MAPVGQALIATQGWQAAFLSMAVLAALMVPLALAVAGRPSAAGRGGGPATLRVALSEALSHRGYLYLTAGFFVCGFQVVFVAVHLPAYLKDLGLPGATAATALALIGIFNIAGTYACGALGGMYPKKWVLAGLYVLRAMVIAVFLAAPRARCRSTSSPRPGIPVAGHGTADQRGGRPHFRVRYLSTLFGIVFFGHQVGSFLGVWLGGVVYDATGSYDAIWIASIILGLGAACCMPPSPNGRWPSRRWLPARPPRPAGLKRDQPAGGRRRNSLPMPFSAANVRTNWAPKASSERLGLAAMTSVRMAAMERFPSMRERTAPAKGGNGKQKAMPSRLAVSAAPGRRVWPSAASAASRQTGARGRRRHRRRMDPNGRP